MLLSTTLHLVALESVQVLLHFDTVITKLVRDLKVLTALPADAWHPDMPVDRTEALSGLIGSHFQKRPLALAPHKYETAFITGQCPEASCIGSVEVAAGEHFVPEREAGRFDHCSCPRDEGPS